MRAYIIDDEIDSIDTLVFDLKNYCPEVSIEKTFTSAVEGLQELVKNPPQLLFLDIQMPEMNAFELLQKLDNITFQIIFVTAYDEYAIKAFDFNAIDYLMKPVRKEKLIKAVEKVSSRLDKPMTRTELNALITNLDSQFKPTAQTTIALPCRSGFEIIQTEDILYLKAESNYTWIYLIDNQKFFVSKQISKLADILPQCVFFRTHKSYVVNLKKAIRFEKNEGGLIILKDKTEIPVARSRKSELMALLNSPD